MRHSSYVGQLWVVLVGLGELQAIRSFSMLSCWCIDRPTTGVDLMRDTSTESCLFSRFVGAPIKDLQVVP